MKNIFDKIKQLTIYQKIASLILVVAIPLVFYLFISAIGINEGNNSSSLSQSSSAVSSISRPASSSTHSSSSSSASSKPNVLVSLLPSSVEEDLEVKVVGKDGQMIVGPEFELVVRGVVNGYNRTWKVNDGFLRLSKLPSGQYTVHMNDKEGYDIPAEPVKITVAKKVAYKEIDVSDKVVDETQVDVSKEDAAFDTPVVPAVTPPPIVTQPTPTPTPQAPSSQPETTPVPQQSPSPVEPTPAPTPVIVYTYKYKVAKYREDGSIADTDGNPSGIYAKLNADGYVISLHKVKVSPVIANLLSSIQFMPLNLALQAFAVESDSILIVDEAAPEGENMGNVDDATPSPSPEPSIEAIPEPTSTPEPSVKPDITETPAPSESPEVSPSPSVSPDPIITPEPSPEVTPEVSPETTPEPSPEASPEISPEPSVEPEPTPTPTPEISEVREDAFDADGKIKSAFSFLRLNEERIETIVSSGSSSDDNSSSTEPSPAPVPTPSPEPTPVVLQGWQEVDGKKYYYVNGNPVTGTQVIDNVMYYFDNAGAIIPCVGIDVSKYQGNIDWQAVKNSGVEFAIIRVGYRGYGSGKLVEDTRFRTNIRGATAAGLKVGVYFFSRAINTEEAVEEASMCLDAVRGYSLAYPIYLDLEYSTSRKDGRADALSKTQRTMIAKAFCETVQNGGYKAGIYSSASWYSYQLDYSQISQYSIWVAHYGVTSPAMSNHYDIWQYTGSGACAGISTAVDLNIGYTNY